MDQNCECIKIEVLIFFSFLFCREHDKKVCSLGLASLLLLPTEAMPHELQSGLDEVFKAVLKLLVAYKEQRFGKE